MRHPESVGVYYYFIAETTFLNTDEVQECPFCRKIVHDSSDPNATWDLVGPDTTLQDVLNQLEFKCEFRDCEVYILKHYFIVEFPFLKDMSS